VQHPPAREDPAGTDRAQERDLDVERGLELIGRQRREQRRPDSVVEHRRHERTEHVAGRVRKRLGRGEGQLDRAGVGVDVDQLEAQRGCGTREGDPPFDGIPERSGTLAHRSSFGGGRCGESMTLTISGTDTEAGRTR
jgi:hypothetical protein